MMRTWTKPSIDHAVADFLWSQWSQLGLAGATRRDDRWAMDPEALFLFSLRFAPREPRLFGEVLDWLRANGRVISAHRLRNLARDDRGRRLADAALTWAGMHNSKLQLWAKGGRLRVSDDLEPLGDLYVQEMDPAFSASGFAWPHTPPSGKSGVVDVSRPIALAFRLRLTFGVGARAEVTRFLLTTDQPESTTSSVAHASAFSQRNVLDALNEMAEAEVLTGRSAGRGSAYSLDTPRWAAFLGLGGQTVPLFVDWIRLLSVLWNVVDWFDEDSRIERSEYLQASEARALISRLRPDLQAIGVSLPRDTSTHGTEYWATFQSVVDSLLRMLDAPSE